MKTFFTLIAVLLSFLFSLTANGQTQVIKGTVKDISSEFPLPGVNIVLSNSDPFLGATTDIDGRFRLEGVPVGRQDLIVKFIGYKTQNVPNVLVTVGKEVVLNIKLEESVENLNEIVISATTEKDRPINEMAKVSARTFSLEEVNRFSGGRNDVARLATNFAGVSAANDSRNDIVVRGNSPTGLLWRVEGLPIGTTNHFATLGTTGGPVSALNTNLLRTSDFITGAFPAEYGNANAAVFDVKFRNGNTDKFEFTAQASAFSGIEFMAEGPLNRAKQSSFVVSYRYGIASVAATGTSAVPFYQDLSFKLNFGESPFGRFELFGMGGISSIDFIGAELDENDLFSDPSVDAYVSNQLALIGLNHTIRLDKTSFIKTTLGTTLMSSLYDQDNYSPNPGGDALQKYRATEADDTEMRYTLSSQYNKKVSAKLSLRAGLLTEVFHLNSSVKDRDMRTEIPDLNEDGVPDYFIPTRNTDEFSPLAQLYGQGEYKFSDALSLTLGVHGQYLALTEDYAVEPRTGLSWQFKPNQRLSIAYGLHSQAVPLPILVYEEETSPGVYERTNDGLGFMRSNHFVVAHDWNFAESWRLKTEVYYQALFDLPVERFASSYSAVNEGADFVFDERGSLVSKGLGDNYGIELTAEKFFSKGYYGLTTVSLFQSMYEGSDGVERSTAFENQYVFNALFGKEWKVGSAKRNALTFDTKFTTSGGRPYTPIDLEATRANGGREVLRQDLAYSERYDAYMRWDVKFGFRLNSAKGKVSHQIFVDLQNVTGRENIFELRYNPVTEEINEVSQTGFFPDFMYRIQF